MFLSKCRVPIHLCNKVTDRLGNPQCRAELEQPQQRLHFPLVLFLSLSPGAPRCVCSRVSPPRQKCRRNVRFCRGTSPPPHRTLSCTRSHQGPKSLRQFASSFEPMILSKLTLAKVFVGKFKVEKNFEGKTSSQTLFALVVRKRQSFKKFHEVKVLNQFKL